MIRQHASHIQPLWYIAAGTTLVAIFVFWLITVIVPVTFIELRYQYKKFLTNTYQVNDIRGLILPQFRIDINGIQSNYTNNGIVVPAVFIDEPIIFNVDPNTPETYLDALKHGIAHAAGTAFPGSGGLGYYFAHSSTPTFAARYNAVFYLLDKLKLGESVYIYRNGVKYHYIVYAKQTTSPNDISFLSRTYDTETIVLQTCWPPGSTYNRLLVFAKKLKR